MTLTTIAGRVVEYEMRGQGPDAVILCSPSWWPLDAWAMHGLDETADRFRAVAFNHRGVGRSAGRGPHYDVPMLAADTVALMDHLEIGAAALLGFAIGSAVALAVARQYRDRVWGLVLGAVSPGAPATAEDPRRAVVADIAARGYEAHLRHHALNDDYGFSPATFRDDPARPRRLADALWRNAASEAEYLKHVDARRGYTAFDGADTVTQPALLAVGADDRAARGNATPVAATQKLAQLLPRAELAILPGMRHMVFWERPAAIWPRVLDFLSRVAPSAETPQ